MESQRKIQAYMEKYLRTDRPSEIVTNLREKFKIPEYGYGEKELENGMYFKVEKELRDQALSLKDLISDVDPIFRQEGIIQFLITYIILNVTVYEYFFSDKRTGQGVTTRLLKTRKIQLDPKSEEYSYLIPEKFPVSIGISPYATKEEVKNFVNENWSKIEDEMKRLIENQQINCTQEDVRNSKKLRVRDAKDLFVEDIISECEHMKDSDIVTLLEDAIADQFPDSSTKKEFYPSDIAGLKRDIKKRREMF